MTFQEFKDHDEYCPHSYFKSEGCVECPLENKIADLQSELSKAKEVNEILSRRNLKLTEKLEVAKKALEIYAGLDWKVNTEYWQAPANLALSKLNAGDENESK